MPRFSEKQLHARIADLFGEPMAAIGFKRDAGDFRCELSPGLIGCFGGTVGTDRGVTFFPIARVVYERIERLRSHLLGLPYASLSTMAEPLGNLMPERKPYCVRLSLDKGKDKAAVGEVVESFRQHGLPFIKRFPSVESLVSFMEEAFRGNLNEHMLDLPTVLPVAYCVLGHADRARQFVSSYLTEHLSNVRNAGYRITYKRFADALLSYASTAEIKPS